MDILVTEEAGVPVVEPRGRLTIQSTDQFRALCQGLIDSGHHDVILDLGGVEYIDSAGLGAIVGVLKRLSERSGRLRLCALSPFVRQVVELTRLDLVLEIFPSRNDALPSPRVR